jgi:UDP-2,3-diacylglucosamine hydrolase
MKKIIRSPLCIFLFKNFHPDWGCGLAKKVSKVSGDYHHHDLKANAIRTELIEYARSVPSGYVDLLEQLDRLHQSGIAIHFVLGNHDYWDFGYFKEKFGANVYSRNFEFTQDDTQIQVCHGDGLLKNDHGYRLMKKIIRSSFCIWLFKLFHPDWGCALAKKVSKASGDYHHHDLKANTIRTELIDYARSQWRLGYNIVLLGHYHQTGIVEENGNTAIFMGDWLRHFTVTRLDENGWWQGKWCDI